MKKKALAILMTSAMAASILAGCGSSSPAPAASEPAAAPAAEEKAEEAPAEEAAEEAEAPAEEAAEAPAAEASGDYEECTIKFDWWGGDSRHEATNKAVEAFMAKYPGINVEVNFGAWTDWETARALEYQSGTGSDLTQIGSNWIPDYDGDGTTFIDLNTVSDVLDLSQFNASDLEKCLDPTGQQAGVPISMTGRIFYWNKTTFDKAGVEIPKTIDDLIAAGKTFQEVLGDEYFPLSLGEYDRALFMSFYIQAKSGEPIIAEDGTLNVTEEQLADGFAFIQSLEDNHVIPTIAALAGDGNVTLNENPKFIDGRYAGVFEWDSAPLKYTSNLAEGQELVVGDELDFGDGKTGVSAKVSMAFAICASSQHPHEAAMLMNYLLNDPEGIAIMASERGVPASQIGFDTLNDAGMIDPLIAAAHNGVYAANPMFFSPKFDNGELKGDGAAYIDTFSGLSYGDYSVEEAASILYDAYTNVCE